MNENASSPSVELKSRRDLEADIPPLTGYLELDQVRCVSMSAIGDLQDTLRKHGVKPIGFRDTRALVPRIIGKAGVIRRYKNTSRAFFAAMMGKAESFLLPYSLSMEPIVYCFDCWAPDYSWWVGFFKRYRIRTAFFSARSSASFFADALPGFKAIWVPEATNLDQYTQGPDLNSRSIDVLELGRRYEWFHTKVAEPLRAAGKSHLYGDFSRMFSGRAKLREGFARTRISVCFPRSVTHPEMAGGVETVTHRYFESMASGCLLYGHCPDELRTLFGYNPLIEMDPNHPAQQILSLLREIDTYQPLVRKNYQRMREVGTWESRVTLILEGLRNQIETQAPVAS
jgi:hypothetical protein